MHNVSLDSSALLLHCYAFTWHLLGVHSIFFIRTLIFFMFYLSSHLTVLLPVLLTFFALVFILSFMCPTKYKTWINPHLLILTQASVAEGVTESRYQCYQKFIISRLNPTVLLEISFLFSFTFHGPGYFKSHLDFFFQPLYSFLADYLTYFTEKVETVP